MRGGNNYSFFFLLLFPFHPLYSLFFSPSLLIVVSHSRGHMTSSPPPFPITDHALHFFCCREKTFEPFFQSSTRVEGLFLESRSPDYGCVQVECGREGNWELVFLFPFVLIVVHYDRDRRFCHRVFKKKSVLACGEGVLLQRTHAILCGLPECVHCHVYLCLCVRLSVCRSLCLSICPSVCVRQALNILVVHAT